MRWAGYVARMEEKRNTYGVLLQLHIFKLFRLFFFRRLSVPLQSPTSVYEHFLLFV
jgi:hypothetical protein